VSRVGAAERVTQNRVIQLFQEELGYDYLGDWQDREDNSNIEEGLLTNYLKGVGYSAEQITRACLASNHWSTFSSEPSFCSTSRAS
jgi:type I restriction enzyme R subunit